VAISTNTFLWVGQTLAEQRDATGVNVVKRFFGQGEQISGTNYYFTRDHLGSVREMTDSSGTIHYRGDYDPYGRQTKLQGDLNPDVGYAGMYYHAASGLNLTLFRAYDSDLGRWLNRDPLGERGGLNLYGYVGNNPINYYDPLGLAFGDYWDINATMDYYAQIQATSDSGFARTGAQLGNLLLGFFGAADAQKGGQIYADPCSSFGDKLKITGKLGIDVAGNASLAWRGLGALRAPEKLYHFTSGVRGAEISATGALNPGAGLFGNGVYLSTSTSTTVATLQGAHSTEAVVQVTAQTLQQQGLRLVPTWVPGSYRVVGGSIALP
jgi:RHS repeat-associated protein